MPAVAPPVAAALSAAGAGNLCCGRRVTRRQPRAVALALTAVAITVAAAVAEENCHAAWAHCNAAGALTAPTQLPHARRAAVHPAVWAGQPWQLLLKLPKLVKVESPRAMVSGATNRVIAGVGRAVRLVVGRAARLERRAVRPVVRAVRLVDRADRIVGRADRLVIRAGR